MADMDEKTMVLQMPSVKFTTMKGAGGMYYVDWVAWGTDWCNETVREFGSTHDKDPDRAMEAAIHEVGQVTKKMLRRLNYGLDYLMDDL